MLRKRLRGPLLALCALALAFALPAAAAERPSLAITSVTVKRYRPDDGFAGAATFHLRLCVSNGPRAVFSVHEKRSVGGQTKASDRWIDPLGVDLVRVYPYTCVSNYLISWAVKTRLIAGPGTYSITIRVRDGYGKWSNTVGFSLKAGVP